MKVLNIGSCNLDYVYSLDHIVAEGETERSFDMRIFPGERGLINPLPPQKQAQKSITPPVSARTAICLSIL